MAGDYIIQKAVSPDKVVKANRRTLAEYGATYSAHAKYDGCCGVITLPSEGVATAQSRTGEPCQALHNRAQFLAEALHAPVQLHGGLVLIGEAWWPGKDQFSTISGEFRRHAVSDKLWFVANDSLTVDEFEAGYSPVPYSERRKRMLPIHDTMDQTWGPGLYGDPQAKCNELADLGGYDGLILRDPNGTWTRGSGTTGEIVKIKRVLSYDLRVIERNCVPGAKTGRDVWKLVVDFNGLRLGVGSGVPHKVEDVPQVGDIVEVEAMDLSSEGLLREPRFKGIRFDKVEAD